MTASPGTTGSADAAAPDGAVAGTRRVPSSTVTSSAATGRSPAWRTWTARDAVEVSLIAIVVSCAITLAATGRIPMP